MTWGGEYGEVPNEMKHYGVSVLNLAPVSTSCVLDPYVSEDGTCGGETPCYRTIQEAIDAACTGSVIKISKGTYPDPITRKADKSLTLQGGWDMSNDSPTSNDTVITAPTIWTELSGGSLTLQRIRISPPGN